MHDWATRYGYLPGDALTGELVGLSRTTVAKLRGNGLAEKFDIQPVKDGTLIVGYATYPKYEPEPQPEPLGIVDRIKQHLARLPLEDLAAIDELLQEAAQK